MSYESLNLNNLLYKSDTTVSDTLVEPTTNTMVSGEGITDGEITGNLFIIDGFLRSKNYVTGTTGWSIEGDGTAEFVGITLSGGILKYGKTSFTDTVNAGYILNSEGIYIGSANDATKFKFITADGSLAIIGSLTTTAGSSINGAYLTSASITGDKISNATITATQIANATITASQIANATITGTQIASATITATNIQNATITASQIANSTITASQIANATITGTQIASATITATNISNATITATEIANGTITSTQIANATIIATNISGTANILGSQLSSTAGITGTQIANSTISGGNLVNNTVTIGKMSIPTHIVTGTFTDDSPDADYVAWTGVTVDYNGTSYTITAGNTNKKYIWWDYSLSTSTFQTADAIPTLDNNDFIVGTNTAGTYRAVWKATDVNGDQIQLAAITGSNIASSTITGGNIANNTITATNVALATITGANIANNTITGSNLVNNTITATQITNATITGTQIAATTIAGSNIINNTITATQIANATITATEIANATITATQIANNTITASQIANSTITASQIANLTITSDQIANLTITSGKINDVSADKLTTGTISSKTITLAVTAGTGDSYIAAGKTDFTNVDSGFILGVDDSDSDKAKLYIGDSTHYFNYNGTTADATGFRYLEPYTYGENITANDVVCQKPGVSTFTASDDAWVDSALPDSNYGDDDKLICDGSSTESSYINFDLSSLPDPQYIIKAELILTTQSDPASEATISIEKVNESWSEDTVTYNTRPAKTAGFLQTKYGCAPNTTANSIDETVIFDITQWIRQIASTDETNYGFYLGSSVEIYFDSKETVGGTAPYIRVYTRDNGDGKVYKANRNDYLLCRSIVGIAQTTANADTSNIVQISGKASGFSSLYSGTRVFLDSTSGAVTQTFGTVIIPERLIQIGKASSSSEVLLNIQDRDIPIEVSPYGSVTFNSTYGHTRKIYAPLDARYITVDSEDDNNVNFRLTVYRGSFSEDNVTVGDTDNSYLTVNFDTNHVDLTLYGYSTTGSIKYTFFN